MRASSILIAFIVFAASNWWWSSAMSDDLHYTCSTADAQTEPQIWLSVHDKEGAEGLSVFVGTPPLQWPSTPRTVITDKNFAGSQGSAALRMHVSEDESSVLRRFRVKNAQNAISLQGTGDTYIYDLEFEKVMPKTIYASVIRLGMTGEKRTLGPTVVQRVFAEGGDVPLQTYKTSNTDFLTNGPQNPPVYVRDVTAYGFSDAVIDNKSIIYISNATFGDAHRVLRVHPGAQLVIANSVINSAEGRSLAWLGARDSRIFYYNTLWNGQPAPDRRLIQSREENLSPDEAADRIIALDSNPLPMLHTVFRGSPASLHIAISTDGQNWANANPTGLLYGPSGLVGDIRFTIERPSGDMHICVVAEFADGERSSSIWRYSALSGGITPVLRE